MPTDDPVHAIIPLALLEAIRNLDTPVEDGLSELAEEIVAKRLGLSPDRGGADQPLPEAMRREKPLTIDEAMSVFRLVDRRPDADLVFADAGRRAARHAVRQAGFPVRALVASGPAFLSRRVGFRSAAAAARRVLGGELRLSGPEAGARALSPLSGTVAASGGGCTFYGAAFGELLRLQVGFEGAMLHERCRARGDAGCEWRGTHTGDYA